MWQSVIPIPEYALIVLTSAALSVCMHMTHSCPVSILAYIECNVVH